MLRILPVTFTGTENRIIFGNLKNFKRSKVTVTIGKPFHLAQTTPWKESIHLATDLIMQTLASQLPFEYQGIYRQALEVEHGDQEH